MLTTRRSEKCFRVFLLGLVALLASACQKPDDSKDENAGGQEDEEPCTVAAPCPEEAAKVEAISPADPRIETALVIDARETESFEDRRLPGARNVVYDILDPTPMEIIEELAALEAPLIVVYGDGDDPDSGKELARDLAGQGLQNVYFIEGGAPALLSSEKP